MPETGQPRGYDYPIYEANRERFAEMQAQIDARNAAEAADPELLWRRLGAAAARDAVLAERVVPAEGVAAFREAFDEALPQHRSTGWRWSVAVPPGGPARPARPERDDNGRGEQHEGGQR